MMTIEQLSSAPTTVKTNVDISKLLDTHYGDLKKAVRRGIPDGSIISTLKSYQKIYKEAVGPEPKQNKMPKGNPFILKKDEQGDIT